MIANVSLRLLYLIFSWLLSWLTLQGHAPSCKHIELLVLRHDVAVLRRTNPNPRRDRADRAPFATLIRTSAVTGHPAMTSSTGGRWRETVRSAGGESGEVGITWLPRRGEAGCVPRTLSRPLTSTFAANRRRDYGLQAPPA
jgi:hypothetical protein